ncbi:MAG: G8 domain-containing protein, partial [Deinococcales bacterium]
MKRPIIPINLIILALLISSCSQPSLNSSNPTVVEEALFSDAMFSQAIPHLSEAISLNPELDLELNLELDLETDLADKTLSEDLAENDLIQELPEPSELSSQSVLQSASGFVAFVEHDPQGIWRLYRHDQLNDRMVLIYQGSREIDSVAISLDGNILALSMESEASSLGSNFEIYRIDIKTNSLERYTISADDEHDVSISADGKRWVWQGINPINGKKAIYLRDIYTSGFQDYLINHSNDQYQPSLTANGRLISLIRENSRNWTIMLYEIESRQYLPVTQLKRTSPQRIAHPSSDNEGQRVLWLQKARDNLYLIRSRTRVVAGSFSGGRYAVHRRSISLLEHPHLSADNRFISYSRLVQGRLQLYTQNLNQNLVVQQQPSSYDQQAGFWQKAADLPNAWSNADTWGGQRPQAGDTVTIPAGKTVYLDIDTPVLAGLTVEGTLLFGDNVTLSSDWLMVHGQVFIGTALSPYQAQAQITLTGPDNNALGTMGNRGIIIMAGGRFEVYNHHGEATWLKLDENVVAGANSIVLGQDPQWQVGQEIVLSSSDYDYTQAEERRITAIDQLSGGKVRLQLDRSLNYSHWGRLQRLAGQTIDTRAEAALLSRKVIIAGADDDLSQNQGFGGHIMAMAGSSLRLEGVELTRMGQRGKLGRYPV